MSSASDVFTPYEIALRQLLDRLAEGHPCYTEATTLRNQLLENIAYARRHGDTESRRAERSQIRGGLDQLARQVLDSSFTEMVFSPVTAEQAGATPVAMANRVFLAYSQQDQEFAHKLAANLRDAGVPLWVDRWDIPAGVDRDRAIDDAVYECGYFLIVLSPAAVASDEVRGALRIALNRDKLIVPLLYKKCRVPRQLQLRQWVDYTALGPDDQAALGQIQRALKGFEPTFIPVEGVGTRELGPPPPRPVAPRRALPPVLNHAQAFKPEMMLIPASEFLMGSDPRRDKNTYDDERPQHYVYLPDYYLAKTPVTNAQYAAFVRVTGHRTPLHWEKGSPPEGKKDHPVVHVSWYDALAYCHWLSELTGKPYSLPSEAEWEKGARGTDGRIFPWGNRWEVRYCNSKDSGKDSTTPVGAYPKGASPYGLLDMAGNVWEWTRSIWGTGIDGLGFDYPYDAADGREELATGDEIPRVCRGGSFHYYQSLARCAARHGDFPANLYEDGGFRVVLAIPLSLDTID